MFGATGSYRSNSGEFESDLIKSLPVYRGEDLTEDSYKFAVSYLNYEKIKTKVIESGYHIVNLRMFENYAGYYVEIKKVKE